MNVKRMIRSAAPATVTLVLLLALWELVVALEWVPAWILPGPWEILREGIDAADVMAPHVGQTALETALGFGLALAAGLALALVVDLWQMIKQAIYPLLIFSQTIPIMALAPLLIIWFGYGIWPKVIVVGLICFFPIAINTAEGLMGADAELESLLRSMGANRWQLFRLVRLPGAMPAFFTGVKVAATYSVVGAIIGEWVGASRGIGVFMLRASNSFLTARVFAAIAVTSLLSMALFGMVALVERLMLPWYFASFPQERWEELDA